MVSFETDLDDLRLSSKELQNAADIVSAAHTGVRGQDVPAPDPVTGALVPGFFAPDTAFGKTLGMRGVSAAYEEHRQAVEKMLAKLLRSTEDASQALARVAELYEAVDEDNKQRVNRAAYGNQG
ncbi:hypothetical protein ED92_06245 [Amycolatopsis sp. MJM2582]|uniref:hypothetical protein n=1 Tax=Amycolatopsis TaxID=1813 RepID=UPI000507B31C|nr:MULTISPECIES: hypothetical protein [unclassified Amycolatopsis]KFZ83499.1 hypothetical protein ED92_06245 [Amycolatopsis sp. MJM2582]RSN50261.1 hypothetical protein DMC64_00755 [Amycolatopsis sp. WAC 04197]